MLYTAHCHNTDRKDLQILLKTIHTIFSVHGINGVAVPYEKKKRSVFCCISLTHSNTTWAKPPLKAVSEIQLFTLTGRCSQALCISTDFKLTLPFDTKHLYFLNAISKETKCNKTSHSHLHIPSGYILFRFLSMVRGINKIFKAASWLKIKFLNRYPLLQKGEAAAFYHLDTWQL